MDFDDYQIEARTTAIYPIGVIYPTLGLCGEAGEVAEKIKKIIRDGGEFAHNALIAQELGDVLWYLANLAADLGFSLDEIAHMNLDKLSSRKIRDKLHGGGDDR
uniref:Putative nucleotide pyrophosphohydrolase domain-containing protein n=1 Tax=viral metagenome TaxID=1070528 RepID=A0A6M3INP9_9ZZZZ